LPRYLRIVAFCDLENKTEFRLATDLPLEGEDAVSNEEVAEIYIQRWQIELLWKFLKMPLKLDNLITKNENGIRIQIYSCIIAYLILQLIDIEEGFGQSLLDKLRYLQSFRCQHISYVHWFRRIVYST
jgi:putative transposase